MIHNNEYQKIDANIIKSITEIAGKSNVLVDEGKDNYSQDESPITITNIPELVVKPENPEIISQILKLANKHRIPVTPRGAGTGLTGGSVPIRGGISLSMEKLNKVLEIDLENFCAYSEAGVTLSNLCQAVEEKGLYLPLYPGEKNATIGGNAATNAGGMRAVKYGVTRHLVLGLEAVLPTGEIIQTGGKYIKCSTAFDLTQLLIGSEGTLAVITKVLIKLIVPPGNRELLLIPFNSLNDAIRCVPGILRENILPVGIEFMEQDILSMVKECTGKEIPLSGYPAYLMLILESDSYDEFCRVAEKISDISLKYGAVDSFVPNSESAKRNLLEIREKFQPTFKKMGMWETIDVVVPRSKIADFVEKVKEIGRRYNIPIIASGHAGDGNVHLHPMGNQPDATTRENLLNEIYEAGIAMGGTISGEHGLGYEKKRFLSLAASESKILLMKRIKKAFDPNNIMNPGKVLD